MLSCSWSTAPTSMIHNHPSYSLSLVTNARWPLVSQGNGKPLLTVRGLQLSQQFMFTSVSIFPNPWLQVVLAEDSDTVIK